MKLNNRNWAFACIAFWLLVIAGCPLKASTPIPLGFFKATPSSTDVCTDTNVCDWITRVQGQGSDVTIAGTKQAVDAFVIGLKADGVWDKLTRLNIYAGDSLAALNAPLKITNVTNATDVLTNFVSGDYSQSVGLTGNGTNKYLISGASLSEGTISDTDFHMAVYIRTPETNSTYAVPMGASNSGSTQETLFSIDTSAGAFFDCWNFVAGQGRISVADSTASGLYVGSRTAANAFALYRSGTSIVTGATTGGARPAFPLYVHARNLFGTPDLFFRRPLEMYSVGVGLTATDVTNYNARYSTLRTALGR